MEFSGKETIPIKGTSYVFDLRVIETKELVFWYENPREPLPVAFQNKTNRFQLYLEFFRNNENVNRLLSEIEFEGGVQQPLFVKEKLVGADKGKYEVFDGNSRLAAILFLAKKNEIKWCKIKCRIAPDNLKVDDLEHHIIKLHGGKPPIGDWGPERRVRNMIRLKKKGWTSKRIADEFQGDETENSVNKKLLAHRLLVSLPPEARKNKWSILEVISSGPKFEKLEKKPAHKKLLLEAIKRPNQAGATQGQLRDYLDVFLKTPIRKLKKWIKNEELGKIADRRSMRKASSRATIEKRVQEDSAIRSTIATTLKKANLLLVRLHQDLNKGSREKILAKVSITEINVKMGQLETHIKNIVTRWTNLKTNKAT
jgi:hypothetical protein